MTPTRLTLAASVILVALNGRSWGGPAPAPSPPATPPPSALEAYFTQDYMLGTWGGLRTDLSQKGIDFEFFYIGSMPSNLSGGIQTGTAYEHGALATMDLNFEKLLGWTGGHFHIGGVSVEGDPFSEHFVGDLNKTNLVDLPHGTRLWEMYLEQHLFSDQLIVKAGVMSVDRDFIVPELYGSMANITLLNQTFFYPTLAFNLYDIPGFPPGNHALPSTPYGALGAFVKWQPTKQFYAQAAIYDGDPDMSRSGTNFRLSNDEGALMYYEVGYKRNQEKEDTGLPGNYKLGAYYHTDDFYDIYGTIGSAFGFGKATPPTHSGNYGFYFLAEQMLYREQQKDDPAQQGLVGFFRVEGAPADRNLTQFGVDGGLVYKGLIHGRDYDTLALAGSYLEMSRDLRRAEERANTILPGSFGVADYEGVVELSYKAQIAAWWTLQPSLQYVVHPGGSAGIPNSWVAILQTTLRF